MLDCCDNARDSLQFGRFSRKFPDYYTLWKIKFNFIKTRRSTSVFNTNCRYQKYLILQVLLWCVSSFLAVLAQEETEPIQLEKIVVTPGRFTIYDGVSARLSLSKRDIERFPLIDNDVMRAAHIFSGCSLKRLQCTIQRARR